MSDESQATSQSLLLRLSNNDDAQAWSQFVQIYSPLVYGYLRRRGLQDADAADVTQDVLRHVARAMQRFRYDASQGTFRAWLISVVRSRLADYWRRNQRQLTGSGDSRIGELLDQQPSRDETVQWEESYQQAVFRWTADRARAEFQPQTWEAFWRTSIHGRPSQQVAEELGMSVGAVYIARSRVLARLKSLVRQVDADTGLDL